MKLVKESGPNLVILNFHLPRVNIARLCERIREEANASRRSDATKGQDGTAAHTSRLAIILLVESPDTLTADHLRALGADDRIYKPLPVSIVEKRVKDLLARAPTHVAAGSSVADD